MRCVSENITEIAIYLEKLVKTMLITIVHLILGKATTLHEICMCKQTVTYLGINTMLINLDSEINR